MITEKDRIQLLQIAGSIASGVAAIPYNINCNSKQIAKISVGIAMAMFDEVDSAIAEKDPTL